jgi:hypothetical protein
MTTIVPEFFAQSKFESFNRQLNGWGFRRLQKSGNYRNAYYHEKFQRGLQGLKAKTKRESPNQDKLITRMKEEPNFYEIDEQVPLSSSMMPRQSHLQHPPTQGLQGLIENRGKLISRMEEEPNGYEIDKHFPPPSSTMSRQSHLQYLPSQLEVGASSRALQEHSALGYQVIPNHFLPLPGLYGYPSPFYGAAYNQMGCYPPHHPARYPMHYG